MNRKYEYLEALKANNGRLDEISLGEKAGLDEDTTRKLISELLNDHSIEYTANGACNYRTAGKNKTLKIKQ